MLRREAFKFRLEPKPAARILLAQFAGCCRLVWNKALALQKMLLEEKQSCLSYNKLAGALRDWKQEEDLLFLQQCHSQPLQQTLMNLDRALKEALSKTNPKRFPRFKKKGQRDSIRFSIPKDSRLTKPTAGSTYRKLAGCAIAKAKSW